MKFPGEFYSKNITPFALAKWSDGEVYRAITSGVSKDGHPFFPVMPYLNYNKLATEDVYSIIAYLRSLPSVETSRISGERDRFPGERDHAHRSPTGTSDRTTQQWSDPTYGEYVTNAAACIECHTHTEKGKKIGEPFAGGFDFRIPEWWQCCDQRTSHRARMVDRALVQGAVHPTLQAIHRIAATWFRRSNWERGDMQTVMPWMMYANMTEAGPRRDLRLLAHRSAGSRRDREVDAAGIVIT